jgi:hypothetical protein
MQSTFKITLLTVLVTCIISSCKRIENEKVELVYENETEKISIKIGNGQDFLIYDRPIRTDFVVENIDPINLAILGTGIRILGTNKDKTAMRTEINVPSNYLDKDTLTIKVRYGEDYKKGHDFNIPVKTK